MENLNTKMITLQGVYTVNSDDLLIGVHKPDAPLLVDVLHPEYIFFGHSIGDGFINTFWARKEDCTFQPFN